MPTVRAELRASLAPLSVLVALALTLTGCAGLGTEDPAPSAPGAPSAGTSAGTTSEPSGTTSTPSSAATSPSRAVEGLPVPPDLDAAFGALLDTRARALLVGDRDAFLGGLDRADEGFVTAQEGYFDNLAQLPLAALSYDVDPASLVRGVHGYSVVVETSLQLDGFDTLPTRTLDRYRFARAGRPSSGRYLLASVRDRAWEELHGVETQPWDVRPIQVRRAPGVLAVFDDATVAEAGPLMRGLARSVSDVAARVPYGWHPAVVVYALSDTAFIATLDDLPEDDPTALDAVTFTVPAGPGDPRTAATRIALNPRILTRSETARDRLLRHELTHVAVGEHDDHAPVWLSEGLAEWVSVQALAPRERQIGAEALQAVRGGAEEMPDDATFYDADVEQHYALSWWVCEYLAATYGDSAPWRVLDAFAEPGTAEGPALQSLLQISRDKLARRGAALLVTTYEPRRPPTGARRER